MWSGLMSLVYAECPLDIRESLAAQYFVDAIRDEDTQHSTRLMDAKDLKSALAYSMKYEAARTVSKTSKHVRSLEGEDDSKKKEDKFESLFNKLEKLLNYCITEKKNSTRRNPHVTCWQYNRKGHIQRDCKAINQIRKTTPRPSWGGGKAAFSKNGSCRRIENFCTERKEKWTLLRRIDLGCPMFDVSGYRCERKTFEKHLSNIRKVFQRLQKANLKLSPKKCKFFRKEISYLGHVISSEGVKTDPEKIKAVVDWPHPEAVHELRSFLELCIYYRRFVRNFSTIARPLYKLTEAKSNFNWIKDCQKSFNSLKQALTTSPVLTYPQTDEDLDMDANNERIGAVLSLN
ncbi:retrovirus-related Pol polyprotein from transposon 297 [Nephila pilipes]|uniref:RNA-directed DNA polymerase n=1 Tax=Nephila pilipes TaxID=299642 RepID=A0A8X6TCN3_NEPPI|nr:retrovirus-related Pol polyprotein from transposon 297 [Nephila pilipes]